MTGITPHSDEPDMRVCAALITENVNDLRRLTQRPDYSQVSEALRLQVDHMLSRSNINKTPWFVRITYRLPVVVQVIGQRAALLVPRVAHRLIRASRVHQQWY